MKPALGPESTPTRPQGIADPRNKPHTAKDAREVAPAAGETATKEPQRTTQAVRDLRAAFGDNQQAFAARVDVSLRAIANYEKDRVPNAKALYKLAKLASQIGRGDLSDIFSKAFQVDFGFSVANAGAWIEARQKGKADRDWAYTHRGRIGSLIWTLLDRATLERVAALVGYDAGGGQ